MPTEERCLLDKSGALWLAGVLKESGLVKSSSEGLRLMKAGAVKVVVRELTVKVGKKWKNIKLEYEEE